MLSLLISRGHYWFKAIKNIKGLDLTSQLNLINSALIDLALLPLNKNYNPVIRKNGVYLIKRHNLIFYVRGDSEDLYFLTPSREGVIEDIIIDNAHERKIFVDVGANIGYYTILSAKIGSRVFSFEPIPETFRILRTNVKINELDDKVTLYPYCAYDMQTRMKFYIPKGRYYGLSTVREDLYKLDDAQVILVDCIRIDNYLNNIDNIGLVKIDTEGSELKVLHGMEGIIEKVESIIMEIIKDKDYIYGYLKGKGFALEKIGKTSYYYAIKKA